MRRSYISPEYEKNDVYGTLNIKEESNFFASKMLEIADIIDIKNEDLIWYQKENNEQIDLSIESSLNSYSYSVSDIKKNGIKLEMSSNHDSMSINRVNTMWVFEINLREIFINYMFATLKMYRTFEGFKNNYSINNDVNIEIIKYIEENVITKYEITKLDLYIAYNNLKTNNAIKYKNIWNPNLSDKFIRKDYSLKLVEDESKAIINFLQPNSNEYAFDYYVNLQFKRL